MGNAQAPPPPSDQSENAKPHRLSLEAQVDGKPVTTSLTCTSHGAILSCDSELWFKTSTATVALSGLLGERATVKQDWLQFDLQAADLDSRKLVSRANVAKDIEGVATIVKSDACACEFLGGKFKIKKQGWYCLRGDADSDCVFLVETDAGKELVRAGSSFWKLVKCMENELLNVYVCARAREILEVPQRVNFSVCFQNKDLDVESVHVRPLGPSAVQDEQLDGLETQSDFSLT